MQTLNISSRSDDWRARKLSNFPRTPFVLDNETLESVEGFIQGIKFPKDNPNRKATFLLWGIVAKRSGRHGSKEFVWWEGKIISYGSPEHHQLIERAIRAKFYQNTQAMEALMATKGLTLTHDLGHPESPFTSLPAKVFCKILTRIREEQM